MPALVLNDVPAPLFYQIDRLARARMRTPADTVLELLRTALSTVAPVELEARRPREPFLTGECSAPFTIPRPEGVRVEPIDIAEYVPRPHDLSTE